MDDDDMLVIGYACRIFANDERSEEVAEERHLVTWNGDGSLKMDRFDCRLLLTTIDESKTLVTICPTEAMEEDLCEEMRYKDMFTDIRTKAMEMEEDKKRRRTEVAFDYGGSTEGSSKANQSESDSDDEPFQVPEGIKFPMGLQLPETQNVNHIIERTALFVVEKGPQMEIVIKAKQRHNYEQFGFMDFDNLLYPYYKYLCKLIREKKYTPDLTKKKEKKKKTKTDDKPANSLLALQALGSDSDDSDSDCELHPSLFASSMKKEESAPDILDQTENASGPRRRPASPSKPATKTSHIRADYDMSKSSDMYSSLFKNLLEVSGRAESKKEETVVVENKENSVQKSGISQTSQSGTFTPPSQLIDGVDEDYRSWWNSFYGTPCPYLAPAPMRPPPPDQAELIMKYAEFVARHGADAEQVLKDRSDLQLEFMHSTSLYYSYYQHKVRVAQWQLAKEAHERELIVAATSAPPPPPDRANSPMSPSSSISLDGTPAALNRRQRRRLQDAAGRVVAPPPGVFDPTAVKSDIPKAQSCPTLSSNDGRTAPPKSLKLAGPVSFSISVPKDEPKMLGTNATDDLSDDLLQDLDASTINSPATLVLTSSSLEPPVPPTIPNNMQLDRKEKARMFMERVLNEKRSKKVKDAEEAKIKELEKKKAEIEKQLAEESREHGISHLGEEPPTLDSLDSIINSRIDRLFESTGLHIHEDAAEASKDQDDDDARSRKKKDKKKSRKHERDRRRSRSKSLDSDDDRRRKRRRSRSRSRHRSRDRDSERSNRRR